MRVLVTGAGAPGGAGIINALLAEEGVEVISGDKDKYAAGKFLTKNFVLLENAKHDNFVENLIASVIAHQIELIIPLVTDELNILSKNLNRFEEIGCKVLVSKEDDLLIANSKGKLYLYLKEAGIITPRFQVCSDFSSFEKNLHNLGYPNVPVVMKPSNSNGSRGIRVIDDSIDSASILFNEKPGSLKVTYSLLRPILEKAKLPELVLAEYLPGQEITVDTIIANGNVLLEVQRTRQNIRSGISVSGQFVYLEQISETVSAIARSLPGLFGPIGFQFKQAKDGMYKILEINPRLQGTTVAALGLGLNIPIMCLKLLKGEEVNYKNTSENISFVRYYKELFYDHL